MKAITLSKPQKAACDGQCRLIYFDEAGFSASPSVQRGWHPVASRIASRPTRIADVQSWARSVSAPIR
jgi:hypothetical protein